MSIKKYIAENRDKFDHKEPRSNLWESIAPQISPAPKKRKNYLWLAAVLILAISLPLVWQTRHSASISAPKQLLPSSFLSLEKNYSQELDSLQNRINTVEWKSDPDLDWLNEELKALDEINKKYRNDIGRGVPEEELIKVLIDYYEKRLHLLIRIERELKRKEKHHRHENITL